MAEHMESGPVSAHILVRTEEGTADDIAERLRETVAHAQVNRVTGVYDIVVSLTVDGTEYVTRTVRDQVLPVDGVVEAEPLIWSEGAPMDRLKGVEVHEEKGDV
jgi:DNA-binding Lrp family transcriptional regulator